MTYNSFGEPQSYSASFGATALYSADYGTRDGLGRIVTKTEAVQGVSHTYGYSYDAVGRLTDVTKDGVLASHYAYDANGNRTSAPGLTAAPTHDAQDRMLSYGSCSYAYKADGSLQTKTCGTSTTSYDYDAFGNLRHVTLPTGTKIDYLIDGQNRRIGKKVNGVLVEGFLYRSQLKPAAWLDGTGAVKATFVYGLHPNVPEYMVQGTNTYRIITDQVGSVRLVVNTATGAVAERIDWDEFGNVLSDTAPGTQPFGFSGGLRDVDTGLVRFDIRDYDPLTGRWTAKDPLMFGGGDTDLYAYCGSDPINCLDPSGRYGFGFNFGAGAEGGLPGILGSGVNVSSGPGVFFDQNMPLLSGNPFSAGWLTSFGVFAEAPGADGLFAPAGQPQACTQVRPAVAGAFAGLGVGPYLTNANSADAMKGPFNVISLNIGFGPGISVTFAYDSQTWVVGVSGRLPSGGWSMSSYPTYTVGPTFGHR